VRYDLTDEGLRRDTHVEVFTAGGPGGQHRNKTQSGVRLRHTPSGVTVLATERRSQVANLKVAFERLRERLEILTRPRKARVETRPTRSSQRRRLDAKARAGQKKRDRRERPGND
jgi:protein subunit release factor B